MGIALAGEPGKEGSRRPRSARTRARALVLAAGLAVSLVPATAQAEGGFDSYLSNVTSGYTSRAWTDYANDTASSTTNASGCSRSDGASFTLTAELRKRRSFAPDVNYGGKSLSSCTWSSPTVSWGNPGSGTFFNQFYHYNFGYVSARSLRVRY